MLTHFFKFLVIKHLSSEGIKVRLLCNSKTLDPPSKDKDAFQKKLDEWKKNLSNEKKDIFYNNHEETLYLNN